LSALGTILPFELDADGIIVARHAESGLREINYRIEFSERPLLSCGMTNVLPDTIRRLYTDPGEYIDSDHPAVEEFARVAVAAGASDRDKASGLYKAVRDGIRYSPYVNMRTSETFRASSVLAAGTGYCVGKAALYAAACRVHGIAARVGFADVRNHLTTEKLRQSMGTDIFTWHGYTEVHVDGAWRKATRPSTPPCAPRSACSRSISTATPTRCCIPSTAPGGPTCNMSGITGRTTTFPQNS